MHVVTVKKNNDILKSVDFLKKSTSFQPVDLMPITKLSDE